MLENDQINSIIHQNINAVISSVFVVSFTVGIGLIVWHASTGKNPIADFLVETSVTRQMLQ